MKVNLNQKFRTPFGEILTNEKTIGEAVGQSLFYASGLNPDDAYKAWSLSVRIASSPSEVEIDEKDIDFEKWIWYYNKCKNKPKKKY